MRFTEGLWEPKTNGMEHEVYKNSPSGVHNGHYVEARSSPNSAEEHVMPIAIVGMSCRFPGGATNPSKLWDMLANAQSGWSKIPANRFTQESFHHPSTEVGGTFNARGGHFLEEDISLFDAPFFSIGPSEANALDPQIRLQLESAYEALENGGMTIESVARSNTAVYVGVFSNDYDRMLLCDSESISAYHATGNGNAMFSNRISYYFDLKGPSVTVDTGCSASLVALHQACQSIRSGESQQAIVGGTNLLLDPRTMMYLGKVGFLSDEGRCYSFDSRASGYGRGEGVASIVIKPLKDALAAGDPIRAVIRNTAVNQDGRTPGITMPSSEAQENLIRAAYAQAGLHPDGTVYVEAHGTGTSIGDPLEVQAIAAAFSTETQRTSATPLFIGSIKTNIGHLESASGLAGLLKAALSLEKGYILPNINFEKANEALLLDRRNLKVPRTLQPWPECQVRRASVNSFGYGGTNAHVILEAHECVETKNARMMKTDQYLKAATNDVGPILNQRRISSCQTEDRPSLILVLSHKTRAGVLALADETKKLLNQQRKDPFSHEDLCDLAHTLFSRRSLFIWRIAIPAKTVEEFTTGLDTSQLLPGRALRDPRVAFVFTGQGAQWYAMGRELLTSCKVFKDSLDASDSHLKSIGASWSLTDELMKSVAESRVNMAAIGQPLTTAVQLALVDLLASWNIRPTAVIGHSSGEIAAAFACGAITSQSAITVAYHRGRLASTHLEQNIKVRGAMIAVGLSFEEVQGFINKISSGKGKAVIACVNSAQSVTVSGDRTAILRLQSMLEARQIFARRLAVSTAYHSHHMDIVAEEYLAALQDLPVPSENHDISFFSTVTGARLNVEGLDAGYWVKNMVSQVRFSEALRCMCTSRSPVYDSDWTNSAPEILVEIGPHSALAGPIKQNLATLSTKDGEPRYLFCLSRYQDAIRTTWALASDLFVAGCPINLKVINFGEGHDQPKVLVDLPVYPWDHSTSYWQESRLSSEFRLREAPRNALLGASCPDSSSLEPKWRNVLRISEIPWVRGHLIQSNIVFPAAGYIAMAIEAARLGSRRTDQISSFRLRDVYIVRALLLTDTTEGVETSFALRPYNSTARASSDIWDEFRVFSHAKGEGWSEHCRGLITVQYKKAASEVEGRRESDLKIAQHEDRAKVARERCHITTNPAQMYHTLRSLGLDYSGAFIGVETVAAEPGQSWGTVRIPNTAAVMPGALEDPHTIHPATLDACLQVIFPSLLASGQLEEPMVPTYIEEISVSEQACRTPEELLFVHTYTASSGKRTCKASLTASTSSGKNGRLPDIEVVGLALTSLPGGSSFEGRVSRARKICHKMQWVPVDRFETHSLPSINLIGPSNASPDAVSLVNSLSEALKENIISSTFNLEDLARSAQDGTICLCLAELDAPILDTCHESQWAVIQTMLSSASRVLWMTCGGAFSVSSAEAGLITGLARSARSDNAALRLVTLDLDPGQRSVEDVTNTILSVLRTAFDSGNDSVQQGGDFEYAERGGTIYVPRLAEDQSLQSYITASTTLLEPQSEPFFQPGRPLRLDVVTPGLLDSMRFISDDTALRPLAADALHFHPRASGINFRDVMISLGQLDDASKMCSEHSGIVTAVGKNLLDNFQVGDRICAWGGSPYSSTVVVNGSYAQRISDDMSFETAASIPIVYATAYYALITLGKLQRGETALIHCAAGGVGQAAVMLGQHLGAKLFVTVGTNQKKIMVMERFGIPEERIFSSRQTSFVAGIKRLTGGKGVDVVLNSITGEGFRETCKCVATLGRFIEIGKRDILSNSRLDMEMFDRNVMFASVDLTLVFAHDPAFGGRVLKEIFDLLHKGAISTVEPINVFPYSDIENAFRLIQAGKHVGKVVLRADPEVRVKAIPRALPSISLNQEASYLIIGGLGGLGRAMCRWMAARQARNIIVISRSSLENESSLALAKELEQVGVRIVAYACDVSSIQQLDRTLALCAKDMPPIHGVIQAAMVLRDTVIDSMTLQDYQQATRPKLHGTRNLHRLLWETPLDFFIMLSSCSGIVGNQGQANYASACTFQDAFARYRTGLGFPTRSLDLGMIESAGYVSENLGLQKSLVNKGFTSVKLKEFLALLDYVISMEIKSVDDAQLIIGLSALDQANLPANFLDGKFNQLRTSGKTAAGNDPDGAEGSNLQHSIRTAATHPEALCMLTSAIIDKVSKVLVVAVEDISPARAISSYGGDSLAAVELRNWFIRGLGANVEVMEILSGKSIETLARNILDRSKLMI